MDNFFRMNVLPNNANFGFKKDEFLKK